MNNAMKCHDNDALEISRIAPIKLVSELAAGRSSRQRLGGRPCGSFVSQGIEFTIAGSKQR
jgi:hypothetical protein